MTISTVAETAPDVRQQSSGGPYRLFWNSIHGGGARSSGGTYTVVSAIGQADAGRHSGGVYVVRGGFLPIKAAPPDSVFQNGFE